MRTDVMDFKDVQVLHKYCCIALHWKQLDFYMAQPALSWFTTSTLETYYKEPSTPHLLKKINKINALLESQFCNLACLVPNSIAADCQGH